MMQREVNK